MGVIALAASALTASAARAQYPAVIGRVLAGSQPVPNQLVSLHRVTEAGGSTVATDTTDETGQFELRLDGAQSGGVQFVATRYEGQLYIGDTFRDNPPAPYIVSVGPGATPVDFGAGTPGATTPPAQVAPTPVGPDSKGAGAAVIAIAAGILAAILFLTSRQGTPPARRLLVEIADLDNRNEQAPVSKYEEQRAELLRRLRESA